MYTLPSLPYAYSALEPVYDEMTVTLHHTKHHQAYVDGANAAQNKLEEMRASGDFSNFKAVAKALAFNVAGHQLHALFWENLAPEDQTGTMSSDLEAKIIADFGSVEIFKKEFSAAAVQTEASGWAMLSLRESDNTLVVTQIEKHQDLNQAQLKPLLVCDVWEHAYYLKYQNRRAEWVENFWKIVNWNTVSKRLSS